jgi:hypothetical protein
VRRQAMLADSPEGRCCPTDTAAGKVCCAASASVIFTLTAGPLGSLCGELLGVLAALQSH